MTGETIEELFLIAYNVEIFNLHDLRLRRFNDLCFCEEKLNERIAINVLSRTSWLTITICHIDNMTI
jgi:hypothetical protein